MNTEPRSGVLTPPSVTWEKMVERWQTIEALGFDSVWLPDHFVDFGQPQTPRFEAWTLWLVSRRKPVVFVSER